jgi:hypothetical protein
LRLPGTGSHAALVHLLDHKALDWI